MNRNILIADDDEITLSMLEGILSKMGFKTETVSDGQKAWEILQLENSPKLAILDWMMPGLDGIEICRKVRSQESSNPPYLILLTSRSGKKDIVQGLQAGADDYIRKPFDPEELQARVLVGLRMVELQDKLSRAIERQKELALTDALTSIPNRRCILTSLEAAMMRALREPTSLIISILDFDHFKRINDTYGHQVGDEVLKESTRTIVRLVRAYDSLGRYGGEEFLLILSLADSDCPENTLERIRTAISDTKIQIAGHEISVTVSQGAAKWNRRDSIDEFIKKADAALYQAKENGRNRIEFYADIKKQP